MTQDTTLTDIDRVAQGWSARQYVMDRAFAMLDATAAGDWDRAEILADQIDDLQAAENERDTNPITAAHHSAYVASRRWALPADAWALSLIKGGYRVVRYFGSDYTAPDHAAAVNEAMHIYRLEREEVERVQPRRAPTARAAE